MENGDFLALNNIIYRIHTTLDFSVMRTLFLEQMKMAVEFDSADFYLAKISDNGVKLSDPVYFNCQNTGAEIYDSLDYSRGILYSGKCMVYRESDILSETKRIKSDYYKKVYVPNHWHHALQMIFGREGRFLGVATFYRLIGKRDFTHDDIFIADMIKDHMSYRIMKESGKAGKLTVTQAAEKYTLTAQEKKILTMLISDKSQQEIADILVVSSSTLKKHIYSIFRKTEITSRIQLFSIIRAEEG
jgi:DNA-binding CsgD family transcriptional regulator